MEMTAGYFMNEYAGAGLRFHNRGISGQTLSDLAARWQEDVIALRPDVLMPADSADTSREKTVRPRFAARPRDIFGGQCALGRRNYSDTTSKGMVTATSLWSFTVASYLPTSLTVSLMTMSLRSML